MADEKALDPPIEASKAKKKRQPESRRPEPKTQQVKPRKRGKLDCNMGEYRFGIAKDKPSSAKKDSSMKAAQPAGNFTKEPTKLGAAKHSTPKQPALKSSLPSK
mmetsp:Transcript_17394/g.26807  ORF Transcript_17394/g.26807 Transcript_17394/m.26807 type:complete len:104 (-) Transcript_17394:273-584(-)